MSTPKVPWLITSEQRFQPFLAAAAQDVGLALDLYEWNAELSAACFEALSYVEIALRNAIDRELSLHFAEEQRGIPWFLQRLTTAGPNAQSQLDRQVSEARKRLQRENKDSRHQIVAGLTFGFWTALLHTEFDDLWRATVHHGFPSAATRSDVTAVADPLRVFRNRIAHHDSLLAVDASARLDQMVRLLGFISPDAAAWLARVERVTALQRSRPVPALDTVVVPAANAWPLYQSTHAYVCQPGRTFQPVKHLAFYADREIKSEVPGIVRRTDFVRWTDKEAVRLMATGSLEDRRLADIIRASRAAGWIEGRYQVFDLTKPGDPGHLSLPAAIPHGGTGRGSAFVQRQRYTSSARLQAAATTADLVI